MNSIKYISETGLSPPHGIAHLERVGPQLPHLGFRKIYALVVLRLASCYQRLAAKSSKSTY